MVQPAVNSAGVHQVCHGHLADAAQPLKIRMGNNLVNQFIVNGNKTIHRVVNNFPERHYIVLGYVPARMAGRTGFLFWVERVSVYVKRCTKLNKVVQHWYKKLNL